MEKEKSCLNISLMTEKPSFYDSEGHKEPL